MVSLAVRYRSLWHPMCALALWAACTGVSPPWAAAQPGPDADTVYAMQEIVVQGAQRVDERVFTMQRLPAATIEQVEAVSAAQIARYVPSAHVQTNSRGETLLYLRGAGERQTAIFFDGALLNVPWDNRFDLGVLPAGIVGGMTVAKGPPAIEYGTNVLGGALNLTSPVLSYAGRITELSVRYGTAETVQADLAHQGRRGAFGYAASAGYAQQEGRPLPGDAGLAFNQRGGELRTNTDRRIANAFVRGTYAFAGGTQLGLTLLHVDAEQGVAPEGHVPTAEARLWRYPHWRYTLGVLSGEGSLGRRTRWKAAAWMGGFGQTIEAFESLDYDRATERERGTDFTIGTRLVLARPVGPGTVRLTANTLAATHRQQEQELVPNGQPAGEPVPRFTYRHRLTSLGAAYEVPVTSRLAVVLSGSYSAMRMLRTGDKPRREPFADYGLTVGVRYSGTGGFFARGTLGRKTRFPTMRELFGEALNRFLVNPALEPESALLAEVGLGVERDAFRVEAVPFINVTSNTIDQQHMTVEGQRKRQRINLRGSRVLGVELAADGRLGYHLHARGALTLMNVRRRPHTPGEPVRLAEKPEALGVGMLRYVGPQGLSVSVEGLYTGRAYSMAPTNTFEPLPRSLVLNGRLGYRFGVLADGVSAEAFVRVDNATDALVVPQLGLPGAGRTVQVGMRMGVR